MFSYLFIFYKYYLFMFNFSFNVVGHKFNKKSNQDREFRWLSVAIFVR